MEPGLWKTVVEEYGKSFISGSVDSWKDCDIEDSEYLKACQLYNTTNIDNDNRDAFYDTGVSLAAGVVMGDPDTSDFSSWYVEGGVFVKEKPKGVVTPHEVKEIERYINHSVDWLVIGVYYNDHRDEGVDIFASRAWNHKKKREISNSRFISSDLGWAVTSSLLAMYLQLPVGSCCVSDDEQLHILRLIKDSEISFMLSEEDLEIIKKSGC